MPPARPARAVVMLLLTGLVAGCGSIDDPGVLRPHPAGTVRQELLYATLTSCSSTRLPPVDAASQLPRVKFHGTSTPRITAPHTAGPDWCGTSELAAGTGPSRKVADPSVRWLAETWSGTVLHNSFDGPPEPLSRAPVAIRGALMYSPVADGEVLEYVLAAGGYQQVDPKVTDPVVIVLVVVGT